MIKMLKVLLATSILMMISAAFAKELPKGFKVLGKDIDPQCGKIAMPADRKEVKERNKLSFTPSATDKKNGYILFKKHYMESTTPYTVPQKNELAKDIRLFASMGEYEPASFLLYTLRPIKKLNVKVSDLRNDKNGAVIGAENIDLRSAVAIPFTLNSDPQKYKYKNEILVKKSNLKLNPERSCLFWLTVYVPKNSKAGIYRSSITVTTADSSRKIPLLVRVFPIKLIAPNMEFGMYIGGHQKNEALRQKIFIDMREHGMNTMEPCNFSVYPAWGNGRITLDFRALDREMKLYKSVGFSKPVTIDMRPVQAWLSNLQTEMNKFRKQGKPFPADYSVKLGSFDISPKFTEFESRAYIDIVKKILKQAQKKNYPSIYFMAQEEASNKGVRGQHLKHFSKLLKQCGVKTTSWSNAPWSGNDDLQLIDKYIDVRYYNYITPEIRKRTKKSGDFFGVYNHGTRLAFGFFGYKTQAEGVLQWAYSWSNTKNMLSNGSGNYNSAKVYFGKDGPLPSPAWEEIREGIDDAKYINTLNLLIAQNLESTNPQARKHAKDARRKLDKILVCIPENTPDLDKKLKNTDPRQWDAWRFKIIRQILKLQKDVPLKKKVSDNSGDGGEFISNIIALNTRKKIAVSANRQVELLTVPYIKNGVPLATTMKASAWQKAAKTKLFALTRKNAWKRVRAIAAEQSSKPGRMPATQTSFARLLYDDHNIYIGVRCNEDQMHKIVANVKKRNSGPVWSDDAIELFIKPLQSSDTYYQIAANSLAISAEMKWKVINGKRTLDVKNWRPGLTVKSIKDKNGWNIVFKIPFGELGLKGKPATGSIWRFNIGREEQAQPGCEYSSWSMVEKSFHETHNWGMLFFGRVPAAMISSINAPSPMLGENNLKIKLRKNTNSQFNGRLDIDINGKIQTIPVCIKQKTKDLDIPYTLDKTGAVKITSKLYSKGSNKVVFSTFGKYLAPSIVNLELLQNEIVSGSQFQLLLDLNISQSNLKNYDAELCLKNKKREYKQKISFTKPGKQKIIIKSASLTSGEYKLIFKLYNKLTGKTFCTQKNFCIIEGIFN